MWVLVWGLVPGRSKKCFLWGPGDKVWNRIRGRGTFFLPQRKASVLVSPILAASATTSLAGTLAFMCLAAFAVGAALKSWTGKTRA